jgi:hypothetical protein
VDSINRRAEESALFFSNGAIRSKAALNGIQEKIDEFSADSNQVVQAVGRAMAAFADRYKAELKHYTDTTSAVAEADVLNFTSVTSKAVLTTRREGILKFIAAADRLKQFTLDIEQVLRVELMKRNIPSNAMEVAVRDFRMGMAQRGTSLALQMRDMDINQGQALLSLTDFLENQWGTWKLEKQELVFDRQEDLEHFRELLKTLNDVEEKQGLLRKQALSKPE